ncbi:helix-turn-helix domain-containing protein [Streptomyces griseoviridis]|uniref:helix-turn-helix domain-containing protein n=1 Tax=Streptomyces griseoviridis TaxID=45398 RepID=UPI00344FC2A8
MLDETVFRSGDVPTADRFDRWRDLMNQVYAPMDVRSDHAADYRAHQRLIGLGPVSVWPGEFQPLVFLRTPRLIRQYDPELYHLTLVVNGSGGIALGKQETTYGTYDIATNDTSRASETWVGLGTAKIVGVCVPKAMLPLPKGRADQAIGRRMSSERGVGALLALLLTQLADNSGQYTPADAPRLGVVVADLVAALFAHTLDADRSLPPDTHRRTLVLRIRAFMEQHLSDPELTPRTVAAAHSISPSYLHRLFQDEGTTVAAWIRRRRLERARGNLTDPALRTVPIHVIAARWGFTGPAEFSRAFRTEFGAPPREFRPPRADST